MIHWTKEERESARIIVNLTYKMGKVRMTCKPLKVNPAEMSTRDFNAFVKMLEKYGSKKNVQPKMKILK